MRPLRFLLGAISALALTPSEKNATSPVVPIPHPVRRRIDPERVRFSKNAGCAFAKWGASSGTRKAMRATRKHRRFNARLPKH